jgi:nucleotide-binding universal stress UspA family protein
VLRFEEQALQRLHCPNKLVVIRDATHLFPEPGALERDMLSIRAILHPTDFSRGSEYAFQLACSLARDHGARLIVVHVTSVPDLAYKGFGAPGSPLQVEQYLALARQNLEKLPSLDPRLPFERRLEEGDPASEIVRVAAETNTDLIVMGTHGQTGLRHLLMGSIAQQVVRKAPCPVLTVKLSQEPFPDEAMPAPGGGKAETARK